MVEEVLEYLLQGVYYYIKMRRNKGMRLLKCTTIFLVIAVSYIFASCSGNKNYDNYKEWIGYTEYVSDSNSGYKDLQNFNLACSLCESKNAISYYNADIRQSGDYLVTDYLDGICINKYLGHNSIFSEECNITIPETIESKPVIKLGSYLEESDSEGQEYNVYSAFSGIDNCILNIPSTIKYIDKYTLCSFTGALSDDIMKKSPHIIGVNVSEDNPYYSSDNGILLSKDKKTLLHVNYSYYYRNRNEIDYNVFSVPNYVKVFAPNNGVPSDLMSIDFPKSIKEIDTYVDYYEDGIEPVKDIDINLTVKGYTNTAAEKWAKKWYLSFIALD